jgi:hypothetical protein
MPPTTKKTKEQKIEQQVKKFLKNNDPANIQKRKKYSDDEKVQNRRKILNELRRKMQTATKIVLEGRPLYDEDGNQYYIKHNRLIRTNSSKNTKEIVTANRKTKELLYTPFNTEIDLLDENFKLKTPEETNDSQLYEAVKDLFNGESELEEAIKQKKVLKDTTIPDEECYWQTLKEEEKQRLLDKLKKTEKERPKTIVKEDDV